MKRTVIWLQQWKAARVAAAGTILILLAVTGIAAADTISTGIEAGAVHACPDGCRCMPAEQAAGLGYVACSSGQDACFHDSFDRALYCYRPAGTQCGQECTGTTVTAETLVGTTANGSMGISVTGSGIPAASGSISGNGSSTISGEAGAGGGEADSGLFASILRFFRSLFGLA